MASIILMTDFSEAYARDLLLGISRYMHDVGVAWNIRRLPLSMRDKYGIKAVVDYALRTKADVVIGQFNPNDEIELFAQNGILAIAQDFKVRFPGIPNIMGENKIAGEFCAEYFMNKGFKNFAFYGVKNVVWSDERYAGFSEAVHRANPAFTMSELLMVESDMWNYDSEETSSWILSLPKPVAIMACDDNHAYYITECCRLASINYGYEQARIPEDIAVLGVDNDETICKYSSPNLSSLCQDVEKGGYEVGHLIHNVFMHNDLSLAKDVIIGLKSIVTRQSTDIFVNEDKNIAFVLKYIHERINSKISVEDIVREVPMSRRLLESRFRSAMGTSIYEYIMRVRIDKMAQLLKEGHSVSDAAFELGFNDIKNISRAFKRVKGMSPTEYKKIKKL